MGRIYTASFKAVSVTAAQDLFEIASAAGVPVAIHGWAISQSSEAGDAAEEGLSITTNRGVGATTGSGGSSVTPQPADDANTASASTVEINNTTIMTAGGGSLEQLECYNWNIRVPFVMWYPPECRPRIRGGAHWTLELETAPADAVSVSGTVWFEENG